VHLGITSDKSLSRLTSALDSIEWLALCSGRSTPDERTTDSDKIGGYLVPQNGLGRGGNKKIDSC
jgi:hypothetical protein